MAVNVPLVVGAVVGLFLLSKLGTPRGTAAADTRLGIVEQAILDAPAFEDTVFARISDDPFAGIEGSGFAGFFGDPDATGFFVDPTPGEVAAAGQAATELDAQIADEAARVAAVEAADLPRIRQFYIDDLVNRLQVPPSFFGGTIQGNNKDEVFFNYQTIYERYLDELKVQAGEQQAADALLAFQAELTANLNNAGVAGTPVGSTEAELTASAQALIDQHAAAFVQEQREIQESQAAAAEKLAQEQAAAAARAEAVAQAIRDAPAFEDTVFAILPVDELAAIEGSGFAGFFGGEPVDQVALPTVQPAPDFEQTVFATVSDDPFAGIEGSGFAGFFDPLPTVEPILVVAAPVVQAAPAPTIAEQFAAIEGSGFAGFFDPLPTVEPIPVVGAPPPDDPFAGIDFGGGLTLADLQREGIL